MKIFFAFFSLLCVLQNHSQTCGWPLEVQLFRNDSTKPLDKLKKVTEAKIYFISKSDTFEIARHVNKKTIFFKDIVTNGVGTIVIEAPDYERYEEPIILKNYCMDEVGVIQVKLTPKKRRKGIKMKSVD